MKKIFILLLMLVLLSACTVHPIGSTSIKSSSASSKTSSSMPDNSPVDKAYSFSEVDALYGPGPFSLNDLAKIFGEPESIYGYRFDGGAFAINIQFNDVVFDLVANNGEKLNLIKDDSKPPNYFIVTESDKSVRMKPLNSCIIGGKWTLPRNMKIGDSRDKLTKAYNGDTGQENTDEGELEVSYDYGQSGKIAYTFLTYEPDAGLVSVAITWYDSKILE